MASATKIRPLSLLRDELPCPQNLDAERSTLGAILVNNDYLAQARSVVRAEDFFLPQHRYIFRTIEKLVDAGNPADLITVNQTLQDTHEIDDAGGTPYLASLVDGIPHITRVEHYARIVKETALKRQVLNIMELVQHNALNGSTAREILDDAISNIQNLQKEVLVEGLSNMSTSQLFDVSENEAEWLAFPFAAPGLSSILDALPKMGKTRFFLEGILASRNSRPFLGHATKPMRVVYVSEQSSVSLAGQVRQAGFTGHEPITELCWIVREHWSRFSFLDFLALLDSQILAPNNYNCLIFDCWHTIARLADENDASEVHRLGNPTMDLAARRGVALPLSRHDRKSGGEVGVSGRSSIALSGLVDSIIHMTRIPSTVNQRKIEMLSRIPALNGERIIELTASGYSCFDNAKDEPEGTRLHRAILSNQSASNRELELITGIGRNRIERLAFDLGWIRRKKVWSERLSS
jgi:DnaB-like helicase N terminal domain/AAA domain